MKKLTTILLLFFVAFFFYRCSNTDVIPAKTTSVVEADSPVKSKSSMGNARAYYYGKLIWNGTNYEADFESGGILTFSGPYPITQPTPVFHILSSNIPTSGVVDLGINLFNVRWSVLPSLGFKVIGEYYPPYGEIEEIKIPMPANDPASLFWITVDGKVVQFNGDYYAVAVDYQFSGYAKQVISTTPPAGSHTLTISAVNMAGPYTYTVFYSIDNGVNWTAIVGTKYYFTNVDDVYMFKVEIKNAPGNQAQATFSLIDWQTVKSPLNYTIPSNSTLTLTNSTSYFLNSDYTLTVKAVPTP